MNDAFLPGTLDLLILKAVSLQIQQGALYPALYRLEQQGLIDSEWGISENNRRAKFYRLTPSGRARLGDEWRAGTGSPRASRWRCGPPGET